MSLNLKSLGAVAEHEEEGSWLDVEHPAGGPFYMGNQTEKGLRIRVAGDHSHTAISTEKRLRDQQLKRRVTLDAEGLRQRDIARAAGQSLEWEACMDDDGKEIPLTVENARVLYQAGPFIAEQVLGRAGDHGRFFPPSSPGQ